MRLNLSTVLILATLLVPMSAVAAPIQLQWNAHVLQLNGFPIDTVADVHVAFREGPEPESGLIWEDTFASQTVLDGGVHVVLGSQAVLQSHDLPPAGAWVHVAVDGTAPIAPHLLPVVPAAARADFLNMGEGQCDASNVGRMRVDAQREVWLCTPNGQWTRLASTWEHEHEPFVTAPPPAGSGQGELRGGLELDSGNIASVGFIYSTGIDGVVSQGARDAYVRVTDPNGALLWSDQIGEPDMEGFESLTVLPNGDLVAAGYSETHPRGGLVARWTQSGASVASEQMSGHGVRGFTDVCSDGSGGYYISGTADGWYQRQYTSIDAVVLHYNADNTLDWVHRPRWAEWEVMDTLALLPNGNVIVAGTNQSAPPGSTYIGGDRDVFVQILDIEGNVLQHEQLGTADLDSPSGFAIHDDGSIALVGQTDGTFDGQVDPAPGRINAFVMVLNPDLTVRWRALLPSTVATVFSAGAWDDQGRLHVAGGVNGSYGGGAHAGMWDQLYVVYDSSGVELFSAQNGTHRNDWLYDIDVARDGDLLLFGSQYQTGNQPQGDVQRRANLP